MVADGRDLLDLLGPVSRRKHMVLACHLLMAEPCLVETAGRGAIEIAADQRILGKHRKAFLGQKDLAASLLLDVLQYL